MNDPVRCTYCGGVYDLGHVDVVSRYADCTVFKTPCCNHEADDRRWVSLPSFQRITDDDRGVPYVDAYGRFHGNKQRWW